MCFFHDMNTVMHYRFNYIETQHKICSFQTLQYVLSVLTTFFKPVVEEVLRFLTSVKVPS